MLVRAIVVAGVGVLGGVGVSVGILVRAVVVGGVGCNFDLFCSGRFDLFCSGRFDPFCSGSDEI